MKKSEEKEKIENMAKDFVNFDIPEAKSFAIMLMSAYAEGIAAGKEKERRKSTNAVVA